MSSIHTYKIIYTPTVDVSQPTDPPPATSDLSNNLGSVESETEDRDNNCGTPVNPLKETDDASPSSHPPAKRFKKWKLSVTDFSAQLWCETQLHKSLITGYRRETQAMRDGIARHEKLEADDHLVVEVVVTSREDNIGLRLLNTIISFTQLLTVNHKVREVWLVDTPLSTQCVVRGIVDEFALVNEDGVTKVVIKDTKTRREEVEPSMSQKRTSAMQLQLYHMIIEDIQNESVDWSIVWSAFKVDPDKKFDHELFGEYATDLAELSKLFVNAVQSLPPLADYVVVEYDCNGNIFKSDRIPYSKDVTMYTLNNLLAWWIGDRQAEGVLQGERWKCKQCDFLSCCAVTPLDPDERKAIVQERQMAELTLGLSDIESPLTCASSKSTRAANAQAQHDRDESNNQSTTLNAETETETTMVSNPMDPPKPVDSSKPPRTLMDSGENKQCPPQMEIRKPKDFDVQRKPPPKRALPHFDPTGVSPQRKQPSRMEGSNFLASRSSRAKSTAAKISERPLMSLNRECASIFK